jgi:hypothetical protein
MSVSASQPLGNPTFQSMPGFGVRAVPKRPRFASLLQSVSVCDYWTTKPNQGLLV